jgi:allophanate hydrolase subunit 1
MQPSNMVSGLLLFLSVVLSGSIYPANSMAQQNKCREHVIGMARIVIQYQKTTEKLAKAQEELEELESRADALSEDEATRFFEVRSEVVEEGNKQKDLFSVIIRKSQHVTEACSE